MQCYLRHGGHQLKTHVLARYYAKQYRFKKPCFYNLLHQVDDILATDCHDLCRQLHTPLFDVIVVVVHHKLSWSHNSRKF